MTETNDRNVKCCTKNKARAKGRAKKNLKNIYHMTSMTNRVTDEKPKSQL